MSLTITIAQKEPGIHVVSPVGSVDTETYQALDAKLTPLFVPATKVIIFNMEGVHYISSMGIRIVLKAQQSVEQQGGAVMMLGLQPQIQKVFDIVKAFPAQKIFTSTEEMDAYLAQIQRKELSGGEPL
jgi:anti-anti-sigma factor